MMNRDLPDRGVASRCLNADAPQRHSRTREAPRPRHHAQGSWPTALLRLATAYLLTLLLGAPAALAAPAPPKIDHPVVDPRGYLSEPDRAAVEAKLLAYREATGVQLAVLIVATTSGAPIEDFAQSVFNAWGGGSKERNDGALFVLAIEDRRNRLQLGYGLEAYLTDAQVKTILDDLRPLLQAGRYRDTALTLIQGVWDATAELRPGVGIPKRRLPLFSHKWTALIVALLAVGAGADYERRRAAKASPKPQQAHAVPQKAPPSPPRDWHQWTLFWIIPPILGLLNWLSTGSPFGYMFLWWACLLLGYVVASTWLDSDPKLTRTRRGVFAVLSGLVILPPYLLVIVADIDTVESGGTMSILLGVLPLLVVGFIAAMVSPSTPGSGSGTRSWSRSSSSRGSRSSSSSSWSSSSSSSSWGGGGGRSGGGGASSSW